MKRRIVILVTKQLDKVLLLKIRPDTNMGVISDLQATVVAFKNPTSKILYDEHIYELSLPARLFFPCPPLRLTSPGIEPGTAVAVKWWGKLVFIRSWSEEDIKLANSVDLGFLCDPQEDSVRAKNPEWLVIGVCTHLGCIRLPIAFPAGFAKGPSPYNLEVPPNSFLDENKLLNRLTNLSRLDLKIFVFLQKNFQDILRYFPLLFGCLVNLTSD